MDSNKHFLYVSYAHTDSYRVSEVIDSVKLHFKKRVIPVELWMDTTHLVPGNRWDVVISEALEASIGILLFISPQSLQSEWVHKELEFAAESPDHLILPVLLEYVDDMPESLKRIQYLDLSKVKAKEDIHALSKNIADTTANYLAKMHSPKSLVSKGEAQELAHQIANEVRAANEPASSEETQDAVFLVHGHDLESLSEIENYLESVGITPVVLSRLDESAQSLFQKFMSVAQKARFAVVLLSSDDYGASRRQYETEGVADRSLQFRARQNVILELGFFYGRLGWENVYVIYKDADKVFPNFERPSDLDGVVFDAMNSSSWKGNLADKLRSNGFSLSTDS